MQAISNVKLRVLIELLTEPVELVLYLLTIVCDQPLHLFRRKAFMSVRAFETTTRRWF
jgi:hypothetical protein